MLSEFKLGEDGGRMHGLKSHYEAVCAWNRGL
jgi:hypothetical protein